MSATPTPNHPFFSPSRIRRQALLLTIALWLGYAATLATPGLRDRFGHLKGADFLHAYILGTIALEHRGNALYDPVAQRAIGDRRVPGSAGNYFLPVYGPQYSLIWMPFALLPYAWAACLWIAISTAIYAGCCYAAWRTCQNLQFHGTTVALAAAAFPGFFALVTFGQNSALALAALTLAYFALRSRHDLLAGLCLGLLAYKPHLALVLLFALFASSLWPQRHQVGARMSACKALAGAAISVLVQFTLALAWYGPRPLDTYFNLLTRLGSIAPILEPRIYLMHSLRAFWDLLLPWPAVSFAFYVLTALPALLLAISCWRKPGPLEPRFAVLLFATVLVAPHLTVYDLVILAPAFLWVTDRLASNAAPRIAALLYLAYLLPFAGPLARWTHVQLSVVCMAALLGTLAQELHYYSYRARI